MSTKKVKEVQKCPEKEIVENGTEKMGWGIRHIQVACMCVCVTSLLMVRSSMGVAVLAMTDTHRMNDTSIKIYDWDKKTQGLILSSFFWGYMVMQIPAGLLAKRFGGKPVLLFALIANGVLCLCVPTFASLGSWKLVCVARVAVGLTQACTYPASHTLLGRWLPDKERVSLSGIVYGGTQLGTILGMPVAGLLSSSSIGWPSVFYAMAVLMLFTAIIWQWLAASTPAQHYLMTKRELEYIERDLNTSQSDRRPPIPWRHILTSRAFWAIAVTHVGTAYGFIMFFVDMPTYLEKGLKISLQNSAWLSALPYIGMWAGGLISTLVCEKVYNKGLLSKVACRKIFNSIASFGAAGGLIGLSFIGPDNTALAITWLVAGLTLSGFISAGFMVNQLDMSPNFAGLILSLTNFMASMAAIFTPIVTSVVLKNDPTDLNRWHIVFLIVAGVTVATNMVYVIFGTTERQPWDDPNFFNKEHADPEEMQPVMTEEKEKKKSSSLP